VCKNILAQPSQNGTTVFVIVNIGYERVLVIALLGSYAGDGERYYQGVAWAAMILKDAYCLNEEVG
jgi:hypothetical protein